MRTNEKLKKLLVSAEIVDEIEIPVEETAVTNVAAASSKTIRLIESAKCHLK